MYRRLIAVLALVHGALFALLIIALASAGALDGTALAVAAVVVGAAGIASSALLALALAPLRRAQRGANAIAQGDLSQRIEASSPFESDELALAFNAMAQSLEERITSSAQERDRLLAALDSSVNAVLAVDSDGQISFANVAAERLFERPRDELLGNSVAWVLPDEQVIDALRKSRQEGRAETCVIERPGRQYLEVFSTPIIGGDWAALLMFHDITDVKRTEQVRRDFVANVSHELRTPLASIKSVIETLQGGALDDKRAAKDFLRRAEGEADRLVQLVEELLELSRIEAGVVPLAREPVEIDAVLKEAVNRLMPQAIRRQVALTLDTKDDLPAVIGDATRLERVALNLIHNAIKFTPAGGSINVSANREDSSVIVRVRDTGLGIEPEELPRIFERFYKTDRSRESVGTGLGLAVVKHTVEAHGGAVRVESVPRQGATFSFTLPIAHD